MIHEYTTDIAMQMGVKVSKVTLTKGRALGCYEAALLSVDSDGKVVSEFIHQSDLDHLENGTNCDWLEMKVRAALTRLQIMLLDK